MKTNGQVNCWGGNFYGQLGNATEDASNTPVAVKAVGGSGVLGLAKGIVAGVDHSCALLRSGRVNCWGSNFAGELGDGTNDGSTTPVVVQAVGGGGDLTRIKQIDAGNHSCALSLTGQVVCWGFNDHGQLGDGTNDNRNTPVFVDDGTLGELTKVKQTAGGGTYTCALLTNGRVNCWGSNFAGELGDGTTNQSNVPVAVKAVGGGGELTRVKQIAAGVSHACALLTNGRVNCWGYNGAGGLGDGTNTDSSTPVVVQAVGGGGELTRVKQITAGVDQTCALLTNGRVTCWGSNVDGELGDGTNTDSNTPVVVQAVGGGG
ncbi:MAG: RCC1 domain-containing protein, partial [Acidimicrobiales bacterium]